jgi:hypothetical protein
MGRDSTNIMNDGASSAWKSIRRYKVVEMTVGSREDQETHEVYEHGEEG